MEKSTFDIKSITTTTSLSTREAAKHLFDFIIKNTLTPTAVLDFSSIEFISRSFADQMFIEQGRLFNTHHILIQIQNINENLLILLDKVAQSRGKNKAGSFTRPVLSFADYKDLNRFLASI